MTATCKSFGTNLAINLLEAIRHSDPDRASVLESIDVPEQMLVVLEALARPIAEIMKGFSQMIAAAEVGDVELAAKSFRELAQTAEKSEEHLLTVCSQHGMDPQDVVGYMSDVRELIINSLNAAKRSSLPAAEA